jgi:hypothetical protein
VSEQDAARIYTIGALKAAKRRGTARPYAEPNGWTATDAQPKTIKRKHDINPAKALGVLYTEWEERKEKDGPEYGAYNATVEKNARAFFAEYKSRLSDMAKNRVDELRAYVDRESGNDPDKAEGVIKGLTSAKGREKSETARLSNFAANLHRGFEHKDAVSCPEFIALLHRYMGGKA